MIRMAKEAFGYAIASGCGLIVDMATLVLLVQTFSWWYLSAATASFVMGLLVAYAISVSFVFKTRRFDDRCAEFIGFAAIGAIGLVINAAIICLTVKYLAINYLLAKCIAAGFTFVCNFVCRRHFLFVKPGAARPIGSLTT